MQAESRFEKSIVVHDIVGVVERAGGRFLKKDYKTGTWYELSRQQSKEKVGHAIRDAVNSYETRAKKKQERHHGRMSLEHGYAGMPSVETGSHEKRMGTGLYDTDYSQGSRKRRRTASPPVIREPHYSEQRPPSIATFSAGATQSASQIHGGLAAQLPGGLQQSPISQNPDQRPRFGYTGSTPGMVANLPSTLQPSPISDGRQLHSSLDSEHHQSRDAREPISLSISSGLHSPPEYLEHEQKQQSVRDLPATLPLPPHANIAGQQDHLFHPQHYPSMHQPIDPQFNPLDPVARLQLMQMQQQREQYFQDHPESRGDEHDHFLQAINAVLGPMPPEGDNGPEMGPQQQQQQINPFLNPDEPQHPSHPQHLLWLQQRQQRETLRRRQQEYFEEQQRRHRPQGQHDQE